MRPFLISLLTLNSVRCFSPLATSDVFAAQTRPGAVLSRRFEATHDSYYAESREATLLRPPEPLRSLPVGKSWKPFPDAAHLTIMRVSEEPDLFLLQDYMPFEQHHNSLIELAKDLGMAYAKTGHGGEAQDRINSYLAWLPSNENPTCIGEEVARDMTQMAAYLFLMDGEYRAEDVQVVRYSQGGMFDLHHDGYGRAVTCLAYLNGVAGTWFPFASPNQGVTMEKIHLDSKGCMTTDGLVPGQDGILVVGSEASKDILENCKNGHVVMIDPGDAILFYNYEWMEGEDGANEGYAREDWRAHHVGMATDREKWIATNWFLSDVVTLDL